MSARAPDYGLLFLSLLVLIALVAGGLYLTGLPWWIWGPGGVIGGFAIYLFLLSRSARDGCTPREPGGSRG